jgi:hypothetical protein
VHTATVVHRVRARGIARIIVGARRRCGDVRVTGWGLTRCYAARAGVARAQRHVRVVRVVRA